MFNIGDKVRLSASALENEAYEPYRGTILFITHRATKYMPAKEFYAKGKPQGYHPGFDSGTGYALYDLSTMEGVPVPFSLYEWELVRS
jgi:hypothetical protein